MFFEESQHVPIVISEFAAAQISRDDFSHYRLKTNDLHELARLIRLHEAAPAELLPIFARLNGAPLSHFESLRRLHGDLHGGLIPTPSPASIKVMRDVILGGVNRRIQNIYREHFRTAAQNPSKSHDQKIASLEVTRPDVAKVLCTYDWRWLAEWLDLRRIGKTAESCVRQLANFAFPIKQVNLRFTHHCNIACRHCYNNSGPHLKANRIPLDTMLAIVAEMPEVGIRHLNLTGGEPFLYPNDVAALVAAGRSARLEGISIYTNGYWASTDERASQVLARLAKHGFMQGRNDFIKVSAGVYHQEFIAFERVLTLARNYHAQFGRRLRIDFELSPGGDTSLESVKNRIGDAGLMDKVRLHFRCIAPLGRGKYIEKTTTDPIKVPCHAIDQITFDPDGSARPCCGYNNENQGIVIGLSKQHRLSDLIKRMQNNPILQFLATSPMNEIFEFLGTPKKQEGYGGQCHLCQHALGAMTDAEPLKAALFEQQDFYPFWFTLGLKYKYKDVRFVSSQSIPESALD